LAAPSASEDKPLDATRASHFGSPLLHVVNLGRVASEPDIRPAVATVREARINACRSPKAGRTTGGQRNDILAPSHQKSTFLILQYA
jgi:hypothetical protein